MNSSIKKSALILPGGGARGSYQVGVIKAISEFMPSAFGFDILNGTSAGAINATVLATRANDLNLAAQRLEHFWTTIHCHDIYRTDFRQVWKTMLRLWGSFLFGRFGLSAPKSLLDNQPMHELLSENLKLNQIQKWIDEGQLQGLSITASSYDTAIAKCFFQAHSSVKPWKRSRRVGLSEKITIEHVMASTALPFLFPAQLVGNEHYGDGGLRMTAPLSPAIHLGADRIMVIGTRDESEIIPPTQPSEYPSMGSLGGYLLDTIFMDTLIADLSRLNRINKTLSMLSAEKREETGLRPIQTLIIKPSVDVREITASHADAIPKPVQTLLKMIGGWGKDWRMPSYLLFEPAYTKNLIKLGYQDAMKQEEEIRDFFNDKESVF